MKIEMRGPDSYRVRKTVQGKTYTISFDYKPTQKEIQIRMAEIMSQDDVAQRGTFESYATEYIDNRSNVLSPSSIRTYNTIMRRISAKFKARNIYDITQEHVQKEINDLATKLAPKTVRSTHGFIASVLGAIRPQFVLATTLPSLKNKERYCPTTEDIRRILDYAHGTEDSVGLQLGILGLRRGEICALEMSDLKGNRLTVSKTLVYNKGWKVKHSPKTDAGNRTIILPDKLVKEINEQGYIYKLSPQKLNDHLGKTLNALNIPKFRFHDLRAYFASYTHTILGLSDQDIMSMGGWKSDSIMKSAYRRSMQESLEKSMKAVADSII